MFETHRDIIKAWPRPSLANFAADVGVTLNTAEMMSRRKSIHSRHWPRVVQKAHAREIAGITFEVLSNTQLTTVRSG